MKTLKKPRTGLRTPKRAKPKPSTALPSPKAATLELVSQLPDDSTWSDLMYHLHLRESVERSLAQVESGQYRDAEEVFEELLRDDE